MATKKPDVKIPPIPKPLADLIKNILKNKAPTARQIGEKGIKNSIPKSLKGFEDIAKSLRYADLPSSAYPKPVVPKKVTPKKLGKPLSTSTAKPEPAPPRPKAPKKNLVAPTRPTRSPSLKGRTLPKTAAEVREADRQARRAVKIASSGDPKPLSKPKTDAKPVDVKGSIVAVPPKASMRPPKPPKGSYEADKTKGVIKGDRELMGRGQKPPRSALSYSEREAERKAKDAERLAAMKKGPSETVRDLRRAVDEAKSPKQKKVAQENLINFLLRDK